MVNIVVFDDEQRNIDDIKLLVEELLSKRDVYSIHSARTLTELEDLLATGMRIDILFADIVMPDGQPSGIEVVKRFFPPESGTQVIYASGYLDQATEVYQTDHTYFLLKPIDRTKLSDALDRAISMLARRQPTMLRIKTGHRDQMINVSTIKYLESSLHKVTVHCRTRDFETYAKLDELQKQLPSSFSRCHRSFLVNLAYVSSLNEDELCLHDGTILPVSRRKARQTQKDMLAYLSLRSKEIL